MASIIQVNGEALRAKAGELRGYKSEHDQAMSKMRTLMTNLNEIFKGEAQTALINKYESMQATFTNFSQMIEDYAKMIETAANEFDSQDATIASKISSFGNG